MPFSLRAISALIALLAVCFAPTLRAAEADDIDRTVWAPFTAAFGASDAAAFNQLHSKDLVRAARDHGAVMNFDEYSRFNEETFKQARDGKVQRVLELRFTERIRTGKLAYEVGIYRFTYTAGAETRSFFGRFHVVLRQENGAWKILVDADSSEGGTITEKDFTSAKLELDRRQPGGAHPDVTLRLVAPPEIGKLRAWRGASTST